MAEALGLSDPALSERSQAVSLLFIMLVPCPLIICPGGQRLCWLELLTASFVRCGTPYVVVREWLESEHKQPTEENVVSPFMMLWLGTASYEMIEHISEELEFITYVGIFIVSVIFSCAVLCCPTLHLRMARCLWFEKVLGIRSCLLICCSRS